MTKLLETRKELKIEVNTLIEHIKTFGKVGLEHALELSASRMDTHWKELFFLIAKEEGFNIKDVPEEGLELLSSMLTRLTTSIGSTIAGADLQSKNLVETEELATIFCSQFYFALDLLEKKLRESVVREREIVGVLTSFLPMLEKEHC